MSKIEFLSTPSARRATMCSESVLPVIFHFYPRPPRGGRPQVQVPQTAGPRDFYPRPPRGGRRPAKITAIAKSKFLSTPSARRATCTPGAHGKSASGISIHALREEGDEEPVEAPDISKIFLSTPSARRATPTLLATSSHTTNFYPRPPRGGRLTLAYMEVQPEAISIHALREEGD